MYYEKIGIAITACALVATVLGAPRNWHTEAREALHYTFSNDKTLDIDNVDGAILSSLWISPTTIPSGCEARSARKIFKRGSAPKAVNMSA